MSERDIRVPPPTSLLGRHARGTASGRSLTTIGAIAVRAVDLVAPGRCLGCGRAGTSWCRACDLEVRGGSTVAGCVCLDHGPAARLVRHGKQGRARCAARVMADIALDRCWPSGGLPAVDAVTWVPADPERSRVRSFHLPQRWARELAQVLDVPALALLERRHQQPQRGLRRAARRENAGTAFGLAGDLPAGGGRRLLLVDDVRTTGATLDSTLLLLRAVGWQVETLAFVGVARRAAAATGR